MKIIVTAIVTFEAEIDPESSLIPIDAAHDAAMMEMPSGWTLEEMIEWEPKS